MFGAFLLVLFALMVNQSEQTVACRTTLRIFGNSDDTVSLADDFKAYFDFTGTSGDSKMSGNELMKRISDSMRDTNSSLLSTILDVSGLGRIGDDISAMHDSLFDIKNIISVGAGTAANYNKQQFIKNFNNSDVAKHHIRFLQELMNYTIPGTYIPLIEKLKENSNCNHTIIGRFRDFYGDLLAQGLGLEATYLQFTTALTLDVIVANLWQPHLDDIQAAFDNLESRCLDELLERANKPCPTCTPCLATSTCKPCGHITTCKTMTCDQCAMSGVTSCRHYWSLLIIILLLTVTYQLFV